MVDDKDFNLLKIGWGEYHTTQVFIKSDEEQKLKKVVEYYQNLVVNQMKSPLHIEESLIKWLQEKVSNQIIHLETYEGEFLAKPIRIMQEGKFISLTIHDMFLILIEGKFTYY